MLAGIAEVGLDEVVPALDIEHCSSHSQGGGTCIGWRTAHVDYLPISDLCNGDGAAYSVSLMSVRMVSTRWLQRIPGAVCFDFLLLGMSSMITQGLQRATEP